MDELLNTLKFVYKKSVDVIKFFLSAQRDFSMVLECNIK